MCRLWKFVSITAALVGVLAVSSAHAQPPVARPQPPPPAPNTKAPAKPGTTTAPAPATPQQPVAKPQSTPPAAPPQPAAKPPATLAAAVPASRVPAIDAEAPPAADQLNAPVLAGAQYLASYDAGMGQKFYLYGSAQAFADVVTYYRTALKDKGELVFDAPATHTFDVGKYKETEVAFPPGVTVKDYTWGGSPGYMNPKPGATPAFFPTVIQIVPPPAPLAGRRD
jgi:hypothetical protein